MFKSESLFLLKSKTLFWFKLKTRHCPGSKTSRCPCSKTRHCSVQKQETLFWFKSKTLLLFVCIHGVLLPIRAYSCVLVSKFVQISPAYIGNARACRFTLAFVCRCARAKFRGWPVFTASTRLALDRFRCFSGTRFQWADRFWFLYKREKNRLCAFFFTVHRYMQCLR